MSATTLRAKADALITATNAFDTEAAVTLFTPHAVIGDPSTGHSFDGHAGIRDYIDRYFAGYRRSSQTSRGVSVLMHASLTAASGQQGQLEPRMTLHISTR
ncbi:nuclear transport factor 2 family protein [Rhizobium leguminosarum]|uniref:nuclear transport factor 2 family protein n=1 Tax=Rhizobium leguminosarum TaxID=384 RepID=UPI0013EEFCC6|nr:nuclear transport factor 2 family protein [Rhizobium leguminosarum]